MKHKFIFISLLAAFGAFVSACGLADSIENAVTADPQKSTCRAYCEWAVSCHSAERDIDAEAVLATCLTQTQAKNSDCEVMEEDGINKLSSELYKSCTDEIDAKKEANDCSAFTGNVVEKINNSLAPTACLSVPTKDIDSFNVARLSTEESNDELCERVSVTLCEKSTSCFMTEYAIPEEILNELNPTALEQCVTQFDESVTSACQEDELYSQFKDMN